MFRNIHPDIRIGTASDRYAGWIGQIYTPGKYVTTVRNHRVGKRSFKEEVLPVESVVEYFEHFSLLEIDFTFYRPLLNKKLEPTTKTRSSADTPDALQRHKEIFRRPFGVLATWW